jgi:cobalamin transport system substrate-binding protein
MAAHPETLTAGLKGCARGTTRRAWLVVCSAALQACLTAALPAAPPQRIVSLVPNVTEMVYAIGAGDRMVGVSSYDTYPAEVKTLPKVGALVDPNVERILSLKPDLVIIYGSQDDLARQLARAGIDTFRYRHGGLAAVTATVRELGAKLGEAPAAEATAARIDAGIDEVRRRVAGRPRPRTLLVFGRERLALRGIYACGGVGFLNDILTAAGGDNVFADVKTEAVQASTEQIISRRPDVILEVRAVNEAFPIGDREAERRVWTAIDAVPAVRDGRVTFLFDDRIVVPGPRIAEGTRELAKALHPDAFK